MQIRIALGSHPSNDEPRILDTDLAEQLGMDRPRNIRVNLIEPNRDELVTHGDLLEMKANTGKAGRPARVFYLNEQQALLVCMFSRTEKAAQVRKEIIDVFMAYRRGHLELSAKGKLDTDPRHSAEKSAKPYVYTPHR